MKKLFGVVVLLLAACVGRPMHPFAEGEVVCRVAVSTTETNTSIASSGSCSWAAGATVAMQCPSLVVTYDPTSQVQSDGGHYLLGDGGYNPQKGGVADGGQLTVDFTTNPDPYFIYLTPKEQNISLVSTGSGTCKFALSQRTIR